MKRLFAAVLAAITLSIGLIACGGGGSGTASDSRNGTYTVFATNGKQYALAVDFDNNTYTMSGNGLNTTGTMQSDASGNYTLSGGSSGAANNAKLRYGNDLLVGGFNFGSGVMSFVAGRKFMNAVSSLNGDYNFFGVDTQTDGSMTSLITATSFSNGTLKQCVDEQIDSIENCPTASIDTYTVTVNGNVFTLTPQTPGLDTDTFSAVQTGSDWIYLRAGTSSAGAQQFRIGLRNTSGIPNATFTGASTRGDWLTFNVNNNAYSATGTAADGSAITSTGSLSTLGSLAPSGVESTLVSIGEMFAMSGPTIGAAIGADTGASAGYLEIGMP